nr:hypothetical protein Cry52Nrm1_p106 [Cryptomonas curvata]
MSTISFYNLIREIFKIKLLNRKLKNKSLILSFNKIYEFKLFKSIKKKKILKKFMKGFLKFVCLTLKKKNYCIATVCQHIWVDFLSKKILKSYCFYYFINKKNTNFSFKILIQLIHKILNAIFILLIKSFYKSNIQYFSNHMLYIIFQSFLNCPEQEIQIFKLFLKQIKNFVNCTYSKFFCTLRLILNACKCMRLFLISETIIFVRNYVTKSFLNENFDKQIFIKKYFLINGDLNNKNLGQIVKIFTFLIRSEFYKIKISKKIKQFLIFIIYNNSLSNSKFTKNPNYKLPKIFFNKPTNTPLSLFGLHYFNFLSKLTLKLFNFILYSSHNLFLSLKIDPVYSSVVFKNNFVEFLTFCRLNLH